MNHSEIEASLIKAKNGNREELLRIIEQYKPFIIKTAKQFYIKNFDFNDLIQIGYMAVINAASKYRTGSNCFSTYAAMAVKNAFKYAARQNSKAHNELSLNSALDSGTDGGTEFIDCIESPENIEEELIRQCTIKEVHNAISKLADDEAELVNLVYLNGTSIKSYAEKNQLSYLHAYRKKNKILDKLNSKLKM
jgi:RNA polymerase sporulation-specific sigma factor